MFLPIAICSLWSFVLLAEKGMTISDAVVVDGVTTFIKTYQSASLTESPTLVVALHGDAPFSKPGYQYAFAKTIAETGKNVVAIGMLRPGYTDPLERTSSGIRGEAVGDNYDATRVDQIASTVKVLKDHYRPGKVVLVGHSGGSAITAVLIARHPHLVNHAFIVSCPCNVNAWRKDMLALTDNAVFKGDIEAVSPVELVAKISDQTKVSLFVGEKDVVTKPSLSEAYIQALKAAGKQGDLHIIEGDHKLLLNPKVVAAVAAETF